MRHGETDWNRIGRVQGRSDIPLNDTGREQARATGRRLAGDRWDAVAASPLSRAAETARIIAGELGRDDLELVPELVERDYGASEGLTGRELDARFGSGELHAEETREQVIERVRPALLALAERHPDERVLVVSHGGVIGSLIRDATGWVWPERGVPIENGSDHVFRVEDGRIRLVSSAGRPWSDDLLPAEDPVQARG